MISSILTALKRIYVSSSGYLYNNIYKTCFKVIELVGKNIHSLKDWVDFKIIEFHQAYSYYEVYKDTATGEDIFVFPFDEKLKNFLTGGVFTIDPSMLAASALLIGVIIAYNIHRRHQIKFEQTNDPYYASKNMKAEDSSNTTIVEKAVDFVEKISDNSNSN